MLYLTDLINQTLNFHKGSKASNKLHNSFKTRKGHEVQFIDYKVSTKREGSEEYETRLIRLKCRRNTIEIEAIIYKDCWFRVRTSWTHNGRRCLSYGRESGIYTKSFLELVYKTSVRELIKRVVGYIDYGDIRKIGSDETFNKVCSIIPYEEFSKL